VEAAGQIDVLVNNAGIGGVGAFEAMPMRLIRQLIETNTIGIVMAMCRPSSPDAGSPRTVASSITQRHAGGVSAGGSLHGDEERSKATASLAHARHSRHSAKLVDRATHHHALRGQCHCARKRLAAWRLRRFCLGPSRLLARPTSDVRCRKVVRSTRSHRPTSLSAGADALALADASNGPWPPACVRINGACPLLVIRVQGCGVTEHPLRTSSSSRHWTEVDRAG
jgi:NAD(P)-dependent dehydrogenase (short-subunit alcohol dehydrogenase family)